MSARIRSIEVLPAPTTPGHSRAPTSRRLRAEAALLNHICRYEGWKRRLDIVGALVLGVLLVPVIAIAALLIVATSRGPAFYTQVRLGRFGRPFVIWKLRTMIHNAEVLSGPQWSRPGDCRVTPLGRILRRLHIDEFPQLWNVLRGEMSLVGPRPERPEFFPVLSAAIPHYERRLLVRPGVTGLAQVYLPPDEDIAGVQRKQIYDLSYIRTMGWWLDLRLILATALQALGAPHPMVRWLLALPSPREIERVTSPTSERESEPVTRRYAPRQASPTAS